MKPSPLLLLAFFVPLSARLPAEETLSPATLVASSGDVFRRHIAVWESGRVDQLADIVDAAYRGHTSAGDRDREGLKKRIETFRSLFAGIHFIVLDQVITGERVATRLEATAVEISTQQPVHMFGMNISVIRHGLIVEEWAVWEMVRQKPN